MYKTLDLMENQIIYILPNKNLGNKIKVCLIFVLYPYLTSACLDLDKEMCLLFFCHIKAELWQAGGYK